MTAQRESLPAVTVAGIVAVLLGLFGSFGCVLGVIGWLLMPNFQSAQGAPAMPPGFRGVMVGMLLFFFALSVFGIVVGIAVIRQRNWARITMLIWGGIMAASCLLAVAFSLVIFSAGAGLDLPNANRVDAGHFFAFIRIFLLIFYGVPAGIGVWWLVLFTRRRVAATFTAQVALAPTMDASGFPHTASSEPSIAALAPQRPSCPLPIAIVAGLMILGSVFMLLFVFTLPPNMPFFFLGHAFVGVNAKWILLFWGLVSGVSGVGLFLLKPWALHIQMAAQVLGILNCAIAAFSPDYPAAMREAMQNMYANSPVLSSSSVIMTGTYFRSLMIMSTLMIAAILFILVWQRPLFLERAARAAASNA
ncbi:MAG TPA: hypothetical protein VMI32_03135 [Candidatus Solibacter sp.]|nr:hypothetical protein [Candidatus Solibacter sp.]